MKLYVDRDGTAPSPRRVRVFLAEKGLDVPLERLDLHRENRTPAFRDKNPLSTLPVLELDDGTCIAESLAICRYFEASHPDPPLYGRSALEQAMVEMWTRRAELHLYLPLDLGPPELLGEQAAARFRRAAERGLRLFDDGLAEREFVAGDRYSVADVVTLVSLDFGCAYRGLVLDPACANLARWHAAVSARPSASA